MRVAYSIALYLLWPLVLLLLRRDAQRRSAPAGYIAERMGWRLPEAITGQRYQLWMHAASVGEVTQIFPLLKQFCDGSKPDDRLLITVNTPEARAALERFAARHELQAQLHCCYCPADFYFAVKRFVGAIDVSRLAVVETEIWPNLYHLAAKRGIQISIINARLSDKTLATNAWLKRCLNRLYRQALAKVDWIAARSAEDAARYQLLGADPARIERVGNLKRVASVERYPVAPAPISGRDYVLMISSREDEELLIWRAWRALAERPLLVIAPRHLSRLPSIVESLQAAGASVALASKLDRFDPQLDILLVDSMGQVDHYLAEARFAIVGGSFVDLGGHNVLQPALAQKYVVVGPYTANIADDLAALLQYGFAEQVLDLAKLGRVLAETLEYTPAVDERVYAESEAMMSRYQRWFEG